MEASNIYENQNESNLFRIFLSRAAFRSCSNAKMYRPLCFFFFCSRCFVLRSLNPYTFVRWLQSKSMYITRSHKYTKEPVRKANNRKKKKPNGKKRVEVESAKFITTKYFYFPPSVSFSLSLALFPRSPSLPLF